MKVSKEKLDSNCDQTFTNKLMRYLAFYPNIIVAFLLTIVIIVAILVTKNLAALYLTVLYMPLVTGQIFDMNEEPEREKESAVNQIGFVREEDYEIWEDEKED